MKIQHFETIGSTHTYLKDNYMNYEDGTVIIADYQTDGVGTHSRTWYSSKKNITMSILYKPTCSINKLDNLTIDIANSLQSMIWDMYEIKLDIKYPNDLYFNGKKIAGILTTINTLGEKINYLIISIGFNVNETDFPKELGEIATSLKEEFAKEFNKENLIKEIIKKIEKLRGTM